MNNYPFQAIIITLNNHKGDFIAAQKDFDKHFQSIDKVHLVRGFLEYLEQKIYQYGKDIPEHQHYLNEYVEKYAPTKYYEKIKPLEEATVREKIARKKKEAGFCKRIFDRCEQDGSNICYCVWLYNEGNFRTHKEREWADGYIKYSTSELCTKYKKFSRIRNGIGLSIFLPMIPSGVIFIPLNILYYIAIIICAPFHKSFNLSYYIDSAIEKTPIVITSILAGISYCFMGSFYIIGMSGGLALIGTGILAFIVMYIMNSIYYLKLSKDSVSQIKLYASDCMTGFITHFTLGALIGGIFSRHSHKINKHYENVQKIADSIH